MKKSGIINIKNLNLSNIEEIIDRKKGFLTYQNTSYFYKRCKTDLAYRELIAHEICETLKIPSIFYQMIEIPAGRFEGISGVICKDYREINHAYVKGYNVLKDYYDEFLKVWTNNDRENSPMFNNLENIWESLNYRYRFSHNKKELIKNIFDSLIYNIFLFDIFNSNADRHFHNWEIDENIVKDTSKLNINYDNEDIFFLDYTIPELAVSRSTNQYDWYDTLREFLIVFENEYLDIVVKIFNILTPETMINIIKNTEQKHNIEIPLNTQKDIISKYNKHYSQLESIIKEFISKDEKTIVLK